MASGFAPEFLILVGIDVFLGASILTVMLDRHFPAPLPYVLDGAALIGFGELMAGPAFLTSFSVELQFYYSFTYAMISVLALFATNLYLLFLRRRPFESAVLGICGTIPAGLGILYFTSAFVNGMTLSLPLVPPVPIEGVYAMFGLSIGLVVFSLIVFGRKVRPSPARERAPEREKEAPIPAKSSRGGEGGADGAPSPLSPARAGNGAQEGRNAAGAKPGSPQAPAAFAGTVRSDEASEKSVSRSPAELPMDEAQGMSDGIGSVGGKGAPWR